jgi:hypothetical protein
LGLNNTIYQLDKYLLIIFILLSLKMIAADNEIYVDQSGATANIDLEQLGSGNIIGSRGYLR